MYGNQNLMKVPHNYVSAPTLYIFASRPEGLLTTFLQTDL